MTPLGQAAGRKNLAKFLGIDMRAGGHRYVHYDEDDHYDKDDMMLI